MYSGIIHRASNGSHVTLGFIFESFINQTKSCDPWCLPVLATRRSGLGVGEPAKALAITYAERTFALPPTQ